MNQISCLPSTSSESTDRTSKELSHITISDQEKVISRDLHQQDDNSLNDLITDEITFPRCEYKVRFKGTSAFKMQDSDHWGTYYRSTIFGGNADRIAKKFPKSKTYTNTNINKRSNRNAKTGTFKSPWDIPEYKKIFTLNPPSHKTTENPKAELYDQLLEYRKSICSKVIKHFRKLTAVMQEKNMKLEVYYENEYPCVLVQIKEIATTSKIQTKLSEEEQKSIYRVIIAYFTAITNSVAYKKNVPIELVNRASFGHNIPSVAETTTSFRINTGIVPKIYAEVLAESLLYLNDYFLLPLFNHDDSFKLNSDLCNEINVDIRRYNNKKLNNMKKKDPDPVEYWHQEDSLLDILCKTGDSIGKTVSLQITRMNKYIDLLTNYVQKELMKREAQPDLAQPLRNILNKLYYSEGKVTVNADANDYSTELISFNADAHSNIAKDETFWKLIENIAIVYKNNNVYNLLVKHINDKNISYLYAMLEKASVEFIKNSSFQESTDGYGSDSDCEVECDFGRTQFYSKKITVSTGMRAINLAQFLAVYITNNEKAEPIKYMYYETTDALKEVKDVKEEFDIDYDYEKNKKKYFDLTHCSSNGPDPTAFEKFQKGITEEVKVIIFDYTSCKSQVIIERIKMFIRKVPILLLVSSGLKNEQIGADINPYGTIRIVTKDKDDLNYLYFSLRCALGEIEKLPKELHNIRKTYKDAGAVISSTALYDGCHCKFGISPKFDVEAKEYRKLFQRVMYFFNDFEYEEYRYNLTEIHEQKMEEIVNWSDKKIKFLGSHETFEKVSISGIDFKDLRDAYDNCPEITEDILDDLSLENSCVFEEMSFDEVVDKYIIFERERYTAYHNYPMSVLDDLARDYESKLELGFI